MHTRASRTPIGILIYTHDRVEDARINMDIIRSLWHHAGLFSNVRIVHAYNGKRSWYPEKYREDIVVRIKNTDHYRGAAELIDAGWYAVRRHYPGIRYLVILAADTWCIKPAFIRSIIDRMQRQQTVWATCPWGLPGRFRETNVGMATDFHIVDVAWANRYGFLPLRYRQFWNQYHEIVSYLRPGANVSVEKLALARFHDACFREHGDAIHRKEQARRRTQLITERMPVHSGKDRRGYWIRSWYWPRIGLVTHHQPGPKRAILRRTKNISGYAVEKLLHAKRLDYYQTFATTRQSYD